MYFIIQLFRDLQGCLPSTITACLNCAEEEPEVAIKWLRKEKAMTSIRATFAKMTNAGTFKRAEELYPDFCTDKQLERFASMYNYNI
jgi:hypothetical protein